MTDRFEYEAAGFTYKAIQFRNGSSPFSEWYTGLDKTIRKTVDAGLLNTARAIAGGHEFKSGRIGKLTDDLNEVRLTKKSKQGGPHLRAIVPRPTVASGETTIWLIEGFKKQTNAITRRDLRRAKGTYVRWSRE